MKINKYTKINKLHVVNDCNHWKMSPYTPRLCLYLHVNLHVAHCSGTYNPMYRRHKRLMKGSGGASLGHNLAVKRSSENDERKLLPTRSGEHRVGTDSSTFLPATINAVATMCGKFRSDENPDLDYLHSYSGRLNKWWWFNYCGINVGSGVVFINKQICVDKCCFHKHNSRLWTHWPLIIYGC